MKLLDLPPVWLAGFVGVVWGLGRLVPGLNVQLPGQRVLAIVLLVLGLGVMLLGAFEMIRRRTTVIPRQEAAQLVTAGMFRLSRNPIYLGDAMCLAAAILWWGTLVALPLIWAFMAVIKHRFISGEEAALLEKFGDQFTDWTEKTRRWL